jgi:hypothetical protein
MKRNELEKFIGKIVCLDLVNRERPVGRITEITEDGTVVLKEPYIFVPVPVGNGMQVQALSYAAPLFDVKEIRVHLSHIVLKLELQAQMEQAYIRQTSGLITESKPSIIVP